MKEHLMKMFDENDADKFVEIKDLGIYVDKILEFASLILFHEQNQLVGLLAYYSNNTTEGTGYITMLIVDKAFRNRNIAGRLLKLSIEDLRQKDFKTICLEVAKNNLKAISFYSKRGFKMIEDRDNRWLMEKQLNEN